MQVLKDDAGLGQVGLELKDSMLSFMKQRKFEHHEHLSASKQVQLKRQQEAGILRASVQVRSSVSACA